jgi:hypothetical protein
MYDQKVFRILIGMMLFVALALYHVTNLLIPDYWITQNDVLALIKLSKFALITLLVLIAVYSTRFAQFAFRRLNRADYVGGCYAGSSGDAGNIQATCTQVFAINQSLFDITILGKTYSIKEQIEWASWNGRAFKKEGNRVYFGITSVIPYSKPGRPTIEHAIMEIQFDDVRNATGLTYSNSPTEDGKYAYWLKAALKDNKVAQCFDTYRPTNIK